MSRLLVVEDDVTIATTLESALRAGGHTVFWASTGRARINAAIAHKPQLVLLDLGLPDLDGLSVCREIRSLLPATIIVLLTARREELDVVSGLESGADDYLTKPFRVVEVLARVGAHLRRATDAADAAGPTTVERMPVIVTLRGHGYRLEAPTG